MNAAAHGCGGGNCQCAGAAQAAAPACINGIALAQPGEQLGEQALTERAWGELLRQEAVSRAVLPRRNVLVAPVLSAHDEEAIQQMLDRAIDVPSPDDSSCRRYYEANSQRFVEGREVKLRHILFAVTEGVDVEKLAGKAEEILRGLMRKDASPDAFAENARDFSNCPSGARGGEIGWITPHDCAEELSRELFPASGPAPTIGLMPRLVHSRHGLHIVEVIERKSGRQLSFDEVHASIAVELAQRSRATALHQYIRVLAGRAMLEGIELEAAATPLVQ